MSNKKMREQVLQQGIFPILDNVSSMQTLKRMIEFRLDQTLPSSLLDDNVELHAQNKCSQCTRYVLFEHGKERSSLYCLECSRNNCNAFALCRVCGLEQTHDSTHTVVLYVGNECMGKVVKTTAADEIALSAKTAAAAPVMKKPRPVVVTPPVSMPKPAKRNSSVAAPSSKARMLSNHNIKSTNPNIQNLMDDEGNVLYYINLETGDSTFYSQE